MWWHIPIVPACRRLRQDGCCKFQSSLGYVVKASWNYTMRSLPLLSLQTLHWTHWARHPHHFVEQFSKSSFSNVFSCPVVAASVSLNDSKHSSFLITLALGNSQKSTVPGLVSEADRTHQNGFVSPPFHWVALSRNIHLIFTDMEGLPELRQSGRNGGERVPKTRGCFQQNSWQWALYCDKFLKGTHSLFGSYLIYHRCAGQEQQCPQDKVQLWNPACRALYGL